MFACKAILQTACCVDVPVTNVLTKLPSLKMSLHTGHRLGHGILYSKALRITTATTIYAVSREQEGCDFYCNSAVLVVQYVSSAGETVLKNTGLGYTVIRAGPLLEEPGGYKALIFDQVPAILSSGSAQHNMRQHGHSTNVHNM